MSNYSVDRVLMTRICGAHHLCRDLIQRQISKIDTQERISCSNERSAIDSEDR